MSGANVVVRGFMLMIMIMPVMIVLRMERLHARVGCGEGRLVLGEGGCSRRVTFLPSPVLNFRSGRLDRDRARRGLLRQALVLGDGLAGKKHRLISGRRP